MVPQASGKLEPTTSTLIVLMDIQRLVDSHLGYTRHVSSTHGWPTFSTVLSSSIPVHGRGWRLPSIIEHETFVGPRHSMEPDHRASSCSAALLQGDRSIGCLKRSRCTTRCSGSRTIPARLLVMAAPSAISTTPRRSETFSSLTEQVSESLEMRYLERHVPRRARRTMIGYRRRYHGSIGQYRQQSQTAKASRDPALSGCSTKSLLLWRRAEHGDFQSLASTENVRSIRVVNVDAG